MLSIAAYGAALLPLLSLCFWLTSLDFGDFRPENSTVTYVLWALSTCVVFGTIALGFLLFRNLLKLYIERRANVVGSRLKTKLVTGVLALSIAPIALHVAFSIILLNRNLDKWFSQPTVEVFRSAERLVDRTTAELLEDLGKSAERLAVSWQAAGSPSARDEPAAIARLLRDARADYLTIHRSSDRATQVEASLDEDPPASLRQLLAGAPPEGLAGISTGWLYAAVPIRAEIERSGTLAIARKLPTAVLQDLDFIQGQVTEWQHLEAARPVAWRTFGYSLALITIFMLFFAVWLAQFASRQITRPIEALVTATGELAGGHLDYRVQTPAMDELGALVESFNQMGKALETKTGQLERSNRDLALANAEIEERRRLIDAILESITPAVISVNERGEIQKSNESARSFSGSSAISSVQSVTELLGDSHRATFEHMLGSARRTGVATRELEIERDGRLQHISVTVSSLDSGDAQSGFVVVLEDNTELMRAQRSEAWQEVAKRLAHEIKNPLTPVALAAGRIDRLLERLESAETDSERATIRKNLEQSTRTIDREVRSLSTLVDSFSDLAGFPAIRPDDTDINAVVRDAASVFSGRLPGIDLRLDLATEILLARIDPDAFKRAIVNLIDNAAEVLLDSWIKEIVVRTRIRPEAGSVELVVADSGPGISAENKAKLFLPYFSTKDRGTGLGLPIVRSVVHDHRGTIRVEDNEPTGTRFVIEVPAVGAEVTAPKEAIA